MPKRQPRDARSQWLKGVLELCILGVLRNGEAYGYDLAQTLEEAGLGEVKGGTLYPALARLEEAGHVTTKWRASEQGPDRKYYSITAAGRNRLTDDTDDWRRFVEATGTLITDHKGATK